VTVTFDPWFSTCFAELQSSADSDVEKRHQGEKSITCGLGHKHCGAEGAAGLMIRGRRPNGDVVYLLQQRASTAADNAGKWGTFGGALLPGETPLEGATREANEELGKISVVDSSASPGIIQKVGKEGYIHDWICVNPPCGSGDAVTHAIHGPGHIISGSSDGFYARFSDGTTGILGDTATAEAGKLGASRDDDLSFDKTESFLANGDPDSNGTVYNEEAPDYKKEVSQRLEKQMSDVSTQDLAKIALGNEQYSRLRHAVVSAVAAVGPSAIDAGVDENPRDKFQVADDAGHVLDAVGLAHGTLDAVDNWTPGDSFTAQDIINTADTFREQGMSNEDVERLKSLFSGDLVPGLSPGEKAERYQKAELIQQEATDIISRHRKNLYSQLAGNGMMTDEDEHELRAELTSSLVNLWAASSNDHNVAGLAVQHAAENELGIKNAMPWTDSDATLRRKTDEFYTQNQPALHKFVRAQYDLTQQDLKKAGIKNVSLYRGMNWDSVNEAPEWAMGPMPKSTGSGYDDNDRPIKVPGALTTLNTSDARPLSSWSSSDAQAAAFYQDYGSNGPGVLIKASVPAERVFSTPRSGNGSLSEREWVVLSTPGDVIIQESSTGDDGYS